MNTLGYEPENTQPDTHQVRTMSVHSRRPTHHVDVEFLGEEVDTTIELLADEMVAIAAKSCVKREVDEMNMMSGIQSKPGSVTATRSCLTAKGWPAVRRDYPGRVVHRNPTP